MQQYYPEGRMEYDKLIRDNVPEIMRSKGVTFEVKVITDDDRFLLELRKKLVEEAGESEVAKDNNHLLHELADVADVIDSIIEQLNISQEDFAKLRQAQKEKKGGFTKRLLLLWSEH